LHRQQQVAVLALLRGGQALEQLQQRRAVVPACVQWLGHVIAAQGRHRHVRHGGNDQPPADGGNALQLQVLADRFAQRIILSTDKRRRLTAREPCDEGEHQADDDHRRERKVQLKIRTINDDVARQMKKIHFLQPRPGEPRDQQNRPDRNQGPIHLNSTLRGEYSNASPAFG